MSLNCRRGEAMERQPTQLGFYFRFIRPAVERWWICGFSGFWYCWWVKVNGVWLILCLVLGFVQWALVGCRVDHNGFLLGFDLWWSGWVAVGCGLQCLL